jgi:predicted ATPase
MRLKTVSIRHYKSLDSVDVDFGPVTVLVGPNGVGKSNFVDALKFFRDMNQDNLDHAVISREGIDRIRQIYKSRPYNVSLKFWFEHEDLSALDDYQFVLSGKQGDYRIESESAHYSEEVDYGDDQQGFVKGEFERTRDGQIVANGKKLERHMDPGTPALGLPVDVFDELGESIARYAQDWRFFSLYPNTLRRLSPPMLQRGLLEDGSNWASVVRALKRSKAGKEALERIAEVMRITVSGYRDVSIATAGSYLVPRISIAGGESSRQRTEQKFDPVQLSDGTLRVFGILLALYQHPAPPLIVIEEPEQTVHPGVLPALADAFKEASARTQIIVTTHSPHLVDQFAPDAIRVVWLKDGLTKISPVRRAQVKAVKQQLMSLEEYMRSEGLQPEPEAA